ncbi:transcriptional regulator, GntR family [Saccharopolyspora kobensis]|uniref:Transcriptional regulator, GntR family n=1 Tax=Saccharopolyspora kobensis TaxID=146035 RepID=A0A1H6C1W1_9PSEU|nr:GntR family transcriptional regulator [Saccharopolyspora kobensis]SEG66863.1 transcriptional regulator, GntR family [Saccharopolyspora kobensis]SFC24251.1 transcriptional regulator, GntR family [Saccharopolyspora kobensis]
MPSGRELAYDHLKDTVLSDPSMQGQFVNEQALADEIGVSRTPIREALLLLAAEELVQLVPKRGAYIAPVGGREIRELFEIRAMIECYAARRAIELDAVPEAEMRAELDAQRALAGEGEDRAFIDRDHRFHSALVRAVGNDMLSKTYDGLRARQIRAGIVALFARGDRRKAVLVEHEAIVDALVAGDAEAAEAAITSHLSATQQVLIEG